MSTNEKQGSCCSAVDSTPPPWRRWRRPMEWTLHALSFDYGQKQRVELERARDLAAQYRLRSHTVFKVDLGQFGQSALTDDAIEVPKDRDLAAIGEGFRRPMCPPVTPSF